MEHISLEELMDFQDDLELGSFEDPKYEGVIAGTEVEEKESTPTVSQEESPSEEEDEKEVTSEEEVDEEDVIDLTKIEQERAQQEQEDEEEQEDDDESIGNFSSFLNTFKEDGIEIDEETAKDPQTMLSEIRKQLHSQVQEDFLETLPEDYKLAFKYAIAEGKPLSEFYHQYQDRQVDLDNIDLENDIHQEYVIRSFLEKTTQFSKARIDREIEKLKSTELLDEEARSTFLDLKEVVDKEQKAFQKQLDDAAARQEEIKAQRRELLHGAVDSLETIDNTRKGKVKAFLTNEQWRKGEKPTTEFDRFIRQVLSNPEHIAQLADIALDYDKEKGFTFDRIAKKLKTQATTKIKKEIEREQTSTGSRKGRPTPPKNIQFDWKKWADQN